MRLDPDPKIGDATNPQNLKFNLYKLFQRVHQQLNQLTEGRIAAATNAATAAPTAGDYMRGDFIRNSEPSELGSAGSKYVILGWECVTSGNPGTWVQCRALTGN